MFKLIKQIAILSSALTLLACDAGKNKTNVELIQDMMDQPSIKAQDFDEVRNEPGVRVPPEGTVPQGKPPYKYPTDPLAAEKNLVNPIDPSNLEQMAVGKEMYNIYCGVCHGTDGKGNGSVAEYMALKPPSLLTDKIRNYKDGRIYHIITAGQGVMGSYASQIHNELDRWAIVNYVRSMQKTTKE